MTANKSRLDEGGSDTPPGGVQCLGPNASQALADDITQRLIFDGAFLERPHAVSPFAAQPFRTHASPPPSGAIPPPPPRDYIPPPKPALPSARTRPSAAALHRADPTTTQPPPHSFADSHYDSARNDDGPLIPPQLWHNDASSQDLSDAFGNLYGSESSAGDEPALVREDATHSGIRQSQKLQRRFEAVKTFRDSVGLFREEVIELRDRQDKLRSRADRLRRQAFNQPSGFVMYPSRGSDVGRGSYMTSSGSESTRNVDHRTQVAESELRAHNKKVAKAERKLNGLEVKLQRKEDALYKMIQEICPPMLSTSSNIGAAVDEEDGKSDSNLSIATTVAPPKVQGYLDAVATIKIWRVRLIEFEDLHRKQMRKFNTDRVSPETDLEASEKRVNLQRYFAKRDMMVSTLLGIVDRAQEFREQCLHLKLFTDDDQPMQLEDALMYVERKDDVGLMYSFDRNERHRRRGGLQPIDLTRIPQIFPEERVRRWQVHELPRDKQDPNTIPPETAYVHAPVVDEELTIFNDYENPPWHSSQPRRLEWSGGLCKSFSSCPDLLRVKAKASEMTSSGTPSAVRNIICGVTM